MFNCCFSEPKLITNDCILMECYLHSKGQLCGKYNNLNFLSTTAANKKRVGFKFRYERDKKT